MKVAASRVLEPAGNPVGALVVEVFRLNGLLLAAGDELTHDLGLTSARWQVLGALHLAGRPLPVSQIARNMGLVRQSVQRVANELATDGFVSFAPNPDHRRAKLVRLTDKGRRAYANVMSRQARWARRIASPAKLDDRAARDVISKLRALRETLQKEERRDQID